MSDPIFFYNDPHPVHQRMADRIGAEFVECSKAGVVGRIRSGVKRDFGDSPVLIEGGVPLFEMGIIGMTRGSGPIIELAADGTHIDIRTPLDARPIRERLAHRFGERFVDATIAVSDYIAGFARQYDRPVRVTHPFVTNDRFERLLNMEPGGDGSTIVCIGKYRNKNGQDILSESISAIESEVAVHFVGPGTENIPTEESITGHGFVDLSELYELVERAELIAFPARVGAYPVAVLEGLLSGTPVLTTPYVGNADIVRSIHPEYVVSPTPKGFRKGIKRAFNRDTRADGRLAKSVASGFSEDRYLDDFERKFNEVLSEVRREGRYD